MKKRIKSSAFLLTIFMTAALLQSCGTKTSDKIGDTSILPWGEALENFEDSSELPDWNGKKLTVNYWNIDGFGSQRNYVQGTNDSVAKEIERVTGVIIDEKKSFDNNSNEFSTRYANVVSSNNFPNLIIGTENLDKLVKTNKMYDLTDLIPEYCPNVLKVMKPEFENVWKPVSAEQKGKIYAIPLMLQDTRVPEIHEEADLSRYATPDSTYSYIWVRDDILKMIYPSAKTQEEIEKQYVEKGEFTREEIFDVTFKSLEEYTEFLRKVKALNLKDQKTGKPVYACAGYDGADNWGLLEVVIPSLQQAQSDIGFKLDENKKLFYDIRNPNLKNSLFTIWSWFREGLSPPEALVDTGTVYQEKLNTGRYAVSSVNYWTPDNAALKDNGYSFQYRRVYLDIPMASNTYNYYTPGSAQQSVGFVKGKVAEDDLPQLMRFVDFMFTKAGQRLVGWGAKSSNTWEQDENGTRKFTNKELEDQMLNTNAVNLILDYGLGLNKIYDSTEVMTSVGWLPIAWRSNRGIYGPYYVYADRKTSDYALAFNPDVNYSQQPRIYAYANSPWTYAESNDCPLYKEFWKKRQTLWDALQKPIAAKNESDFNARYEEAMKVAEDMGLNSKEMADEVNAFFRNQNAETDFFK